VFNKVSLISNTAKSLFQNKSRKSPRKRDLKVDQYTRNENELLGTIEETHSFPTFLGRKSSSNKVFNSHSSFVLGDHNNTSMSPRNSSNFRSPSELVIQKTSSSLARKPFNCQSPCIRDDNQMNQHQYQRTMLPPKNPNSNKHLVDSFDRTQLSLHDKFYDESSQQEEHHDVRRLSPQDNVGRHKSKNRNRKLYVGQEKIELRDYDYTNHSPPRHKNKHCGERSSMHSYDKNSAFRSKKKRKRVFDGSDEYSRRLSGYHRGDFYHFDAY
jgi:hypothetical protein